MQLNDVQTILQHIHLPKDSTEKFLHESFLRNEAEFVCPTKFPLILDLNKMASKMAAHPLKIEFISNASNKGAVSASRPCSITQKIATLFTVSNLA